MHMPQNVDPYERTVLDAVHRAVGREPRLVNRTDAVRVQYDERTRCLEVKGEVETIALKRLLLRHAATVSEVECVADELRVRPAQDLGDGEIRAHLADYLLQEPAFRECAIRQWNKGEWEDLIRPEPARFELSFRVEDGVVTLVGTVPSLSHRRLAVALSWWVPGTRDVRDELAVVPPEEDNDAEIADAVHMLLEKDPLIDGSAVRVRVEDGVVTLEGLVSWPEERDVAERDAWYVEGVQDVRSELDVVKGEVTG